MALHSVCHKTPHDLVGPLTSCSHKRDMVLRSQFNNIHFEYWILGHYIG